MSFLSLAPEVLATHGEGSYTNKIDVWSLGVILYICLGMKFKNYFLLFLIIDAPQFLVGYPPFTESPDSPSLNEQIMRGLYAFPDEFWSDISATAKDLVRQMMCVDPNQRLTMAAVLEHPWLTADHNNAALVEKIMYPILLQPIRSFKRPAYEEDAKMDNVYSEFSSQISSDGGIKRVKYC